MLVYYCTQYVTLKVPIARGAIVCIVTVDPDMEQSVIAIPAVALEKLHTTKVPDTADVNDTVLVAPVPVTVAVRN